MVAPIGNKFAKGNKGGGRKGYEYEKEQLSEMRKILTDSLKLTKKIMIGKANEKQVSAYEKSIKMVLKIMDKLHANRQEITLEGNTELPFTIKIVKDDGTTETR